LFTIGAVISAGLVGGIVGALGTLLVARAPSLPRAIWGLVAGTATIYGLAELQGTKWPVLTRHWEVPKQWGRYGLPFFAAAFGLILGTGFFTFNTFIGYHLLLIICFLTADPMYASILMAVYGAARAGPVFFAPLISWVRGQTYSYEIAMAANSWLLRTDQQLAWLRAIVLFAVAGLALATSVG
jgi:hypothetical protein